MSEPKLISPLLDGFTMGQPLGEHDGVSCCPAIKEDTDKKYIVKIITIPATQTQMDALLLAGAYKDPAEAMAYFRQVGEEVQQEAALLKKLSQLEGFLPYDDWQLEPITRKRLGYQVYLVGSYKRSLEKHMKRNPMTHLEAMNLGLDLCAALSVCRQAGSLYVALKPANIFVSEKKQYRIGDLGFISLDALSYMALPKKYQSPYTPPELLDPMVSVNTTTDTYAVGMILYQLYNDGQLPFRGIAPEAQLPSPANADYELAEIIMKAIHPDPKQRWDDPGALGKALASYMQRNAVNDVPISSTMPPLVTGEPVAPPAPDADAALQDSEIPAKEAVPEPTVPEMSELDTQQPEPEIAAEPTVEAAEEETVEQTEEDSPELTEEAIPAGDDVAEAAPAYAGPVTIDEETGLQWVDADTEDTPADTYAGQVRDDFSGILAKAEDLIQHPTPEGVVLPEILEEADPFAFAREDSEETLYTDIPADPLMEEEESSTAKKKKNQKKYADPKYKRRSKKLIAALTFLLALCLSGLAAFWYYQNIYLQAIDRILINGTRDQITVTVDTGISESLLHVTCSDNAGNTQTQTLSGGTAVFQDLRPSTLYTIQLNIDGFHKLVGKTSDVFSTDATTNILSFTSAAGKEDGSVVLNFSVEGEEPEEWTLRYSAENEEPQEETFSGHSVSVSGLSVGKTYTFTLDVGSGLTLGGEKSTQFVATRLILANNLTINSSGNGEITVHWDTPGDVLVDSWSVRCYSEEGYDEQKTVTEPEAVFIGIDPAYSYTVEVVASGMTQPARASITANPIRVSKLDVEDNDRSKLTLSWQYDGDKPNGGWLVIYTVDGAGKSIEKSSKPTAEICPQIPGAKYSITIQSADGTSVLGGVHSYTCPDASPFDKFQFSAETLTARLLKTPDETRWYSEKVDEDAYADTFAPSDGISIALRNTESFYLPGTEVNILYVIRDAYGNVLPDYLAEEKVYWKNIWLGGDSRSGELNLPKVPSATGDYVLDLYIDGMSMAKLPFTIQ